MSSYHTKKRNDGITKIIIDLLLAGVKLRKTSVQTKEPQQNGEEKESFFVKPQLKPVPQREKTPPKKVTYSY